jgi:hypothetical protein
MMNASKLRRTLRWVHLAIAALLGTYFYSPLRFDPFWTDVIRFGAFPIAAITGIWIWQQGRIGRMVGGRNNKPAKRA